MSYGQDWAVSTLNTGTYYGLCSSADGSIMYAARLSGGIYKSTDYGHTWSVSDATSRDYVGMTCSSDGQIAYAIVSGSAQVYKTSNGGTSWSTAGTTGDNNFAICCSADGNYVYIAGGTPSVNKSNDGGMSFTILITGTQDFRDIACSADGQYIIVSNSTMSAGNGALLYSNYGGSSSWLTTLGASVWTHVCMSADGQSMAFTQNGGGIKWTTDQGANWSFFSTAENWSDINCTSDFSKLIATVSFEKPYISIDGGANWTQTTGTAPSTEWYSIAQTANGTALIIGTTGVYYSGMYAPDLSVISIFPNTGSTAGGTPVTIVGSGFDPAATAAIDGNDLTDLTVVDDTTITGITPAGTVGAKDVIVTNP